MKEIIIAMDSFKGSMTSLEAGNAIKKAIQNIHPAWNIQVYPVADGGEGTLEALTYQQKVTRRTCMITGPLGNPIEASYLWYERNLEKTAVIEMAQAAGCAGRKAESFAYNDVWCRRIDTECDSSGMYQIYYRNRRKCNKRCRSWDVTGIGLSFL